MKRCPAGAASYRHGKAGGMRDGGIDYPYFLNLGNRVPQYQIYNHNMMEIVLPLAYKLPNTYIKELDSVVKKV